MALSVNYKVCVVCVFSHEIRSVLHVLGCELQGQCHVVLVREIEGQSCISLLMNHRVSVVRFLSRKYEISVACLCP